MANAVSRLILLDIMMPVMDGIELCRRIRKLIGEKSPIIFLTAVRELATVRAALEAGGDDFIVKGTPLADVMPKLDPWLKAPSLYKTPQHRRRILDAAAVLAGQPWHPAVGARRLRAGRSPSGRERRQW